MNEPLAWAVPLVIPIGRSWQAFDGEGNRDTGTCDYADPEADDRITASR